MSMFLLVAARRALRVPSSTTAVAATRFPATLTKTLATIPTACRWESSHSSSSSLSSTMPSPADISPSSTSSTAALPSVPESSRPDYLDAPIDRATSTFTPVPERVQDGTDTSTIPAAIVSGAPVELQARTVRIYRSSKPATQSGTWHQHGWRMDWDVLAKGYRWENPLMGWQSSSDMMQGTRILFSSKEDAIAYAQRQGYQYYVQEPTDRKIRPKAYANNFVYSHRKLKLIRTK